MNRTAAFFRILAALLLTLTAMMVPIEQLLEQARSPLGIYLFGTLALISWGVYRLTAAHAVAPLFEGWNAWMGGGLIAIFTVYLASTIVHQESTPASALDMVTRLIHDKSFREILKLLLFFLFGLAARDIFREAKHRTFYLTAMALMILADAFLGTYWYFQVERVWEYRMTVPGLGFNNFAFFLMLFFWLFVAEGWSRWKIQRGGALLFWIVLPAMLWCIYAVQSRAIFASFIFSAFLFFLILTPWLHSVRRLLVIAPLLLLLILGSFMLNRYHQAGKNAATHPTVGQLLAQAKERLGSAAGSLNNRFSTDAVYVFQHYFPNSPWLGIGPGRYVGDPDFEKLTRRSAIDGAYLKYLVESGLLGLLAWSCFLVAVVAFQTRQLAGLAGRSLEERLLIAALFVFLVNFLLNGIVESAISDRRFQTLFWIHLGLMIALGKGKSGVEGERRER